MQYKMIVPSVLWKDFNPLDIDLDIRLISDGKDEYAFSQYKFTALVQNDGSLRVACEVLSPLEGSNKTILVIPEYHRPPSKDYLEDLVLNGYSVVIPDLSAVAAFKTEFPESLAYGEYWIAKERLNKMVESAFETNQFLYSKIIKRTIVFIQSLNPNTEIVIMTLGDSFEIGMQVIGSGADVIGLIALNGSGYREYLNINRFGETTDLILTDELMSWLSSVAAVAYAKNIKIPTLIAIGTNSRKTDMDRLVNLQQLFGNNNITTIFTPGASDYVGPNAFKSIKFWLSSIYNGYPVPVRPEVKIRINEEKKIYFDVDCDPSSIIDTVTVYYNSGEYNHSLRDWHQEKAYSVSFNEYMASAKVFSPDQPLFVFAEVRYTNGFIISSLVEYIELSEFDVLPTEDTQKAKKIVVVYNVSEGINKFVEDYDGQVLLKDSIRETFSTSGARGIISDTNALKTYRFNASQIDDNTKVLQMDLCSIDEDKVIVTLDCSFGKNIVEYRADKQLKIEGGFFFDYQFKVSDFKDINRIALSCWSCVKAMRIKGRNLIIGNILFI